MEELLQFENSKRKKKNYSGTFSPSFLIIPNILVKQLQIYQRSKLQVKKKVDSAGFVTYVPTPGRHLTSNFDLWYFCSPFTKMNV